MTLALYSAINCNVDIRANFEANNSNLKTEVSYKLVVQGFYYNCWQGTD